MKHLILFATILSLAACNHMQIKPNTIEPNSVFFAQYGGYTMRHYLKQGLEERGHIVKTGKVKSFGGADSTSGDDIDISTMEIPSDARYQVMVYERIEEYSSWCVFNGFHWWRFNVSIMDKKTGSEIFAWTGKGCKNSSMRKLEAALDKLEK